MEKTVGQLMLSGSGSKPASASAVARYSTWMAHDAPVIDGWPPSERTRARRLPDRASYERTDVYAVVDTAITCTVGYLLDGRPYVTPTAHWRDGDRIYWHGSAASRFLKSVVGHEACVSVHLLDGLIHDVLTQVATDAPDMPLYVSPNIVGFSKKVKGFTYFGNISVDFWRLWIDDSTT